MEVTIKISGPLIEIDGHSSKSIPLCGYLSAVARAFNFEADARGQARKVFVSKDEQDLCKSLLLDAAELAQGEINVAV